MSTPNKPSGDELGSMPPPPQGKSGGAESGPPVRPRAVDLACLLTLIGTVFAAIVTAVTYLGDETAMRELIRQALDDAGESATDADIAAAMTSFKTMIVLSLVIGVAVVLFFVMKLRAGRNWARVLIVAFAAMSVLIFLANAGAIGLGVDFLINAVSVAISVATIVYLFRAESNAYFIAVKQRRLGGSPKA
ncbi:hypothetical protein [Labedaea rhizosphaerae]|nr:hypothetical protein [Labedaea rhizosphaerae]